MSGDLRSDVRVFGTSQTAPIGVGFLADGLHAVTCAHVVAAALGDARLAYAANPPTAAILIDFPLSAIGDAREMRRCTVMGWRPLGGAGPADIAILVLDSPAPAETNSVSASTAVAYGDRVIAYGVRAGLPDGAYVEAKVLGFIPGPLIQATSDNPDVALRQGCSGAAAWNVELGCVIGMCVQGLLTNSALLAPIDAIEAVLFETTGRGFSPCASDATFASTREDFSTKAGLRAARLATLRRLPRGPALDLMRIDPAIRRAFSNSVSNFGALELVAEANALVLAALPHKPLNEHAYVIMRGVLGDPAVIEPDRLWSQIFSNACMLGPRMLGALLLCAPPPAFDGSKDAIVHLFLTLES